MQIPLHGKGPDWTTPGPVVAYAEVDEADFTELSSYRWALNPDGYAVRTSHRPTYSTCPECGWVPREGVHAPSSMASHRSRMHGAYTATLPKRKTVLMHRQILGMAPDDRRSGDHKNRNRLDNRRSNLRVIPLLAQPQNQGKTKLFKGKPTESKYRGVYKVKKDGGKWYGGWKAVVDGKYLGYFASEEAAAEVAQQYRLQTMPHALD